MLLFEPKQHSPSIFFEANGLVGNELRKEIVACNLVVASL